MDDTTNSVSVFELFAGLLAPATASHIHCCTAVPGVGTAPVFLGFTGFPAVQTGLYTNVFTLTPGDFATLLAGSIAGQAYVNIHDNIFPGGEIRGFLVGAPVPEPASGALMVGGIAALGWLTRRRRAA
jgi:hypothetical protein